MNKAGRMLFSNPEYPEYPGHPRLIPELDCGKQAKWVEITLGLALCYGGRETSEIPDQR